MRIQPVWCDFCNANHAGETFDVDARPPQTLEDIRRGLVHAIIYGTLSPTSHRSADLYLMYALALYSRNPAPTEDERAAALQIAAYYHQVKKSY